MIVRKDQKLKKNGNIDGNTIGGALNRIEKLNQKW